MDKKEDQDLKHVSFQNLVVDPNAAVEEDLISKLVQQNLFCRQKAKQFFGRRKLLMEILQLIDGEDDDDLEENEVEKKNGKKSDDTGKKADDLSEIVKENGGKPNDTSGKVEDTGKKANDLSEIVKENGGKPNDTSGKVEDTGKKANDLSEIVKENGGKPNDTSEKVEDTGEKPAGNTASKQKEKIEEKADDDMEESIDDQIEEKRQESNLPIFIHGKSGSGLSSIMAKTALSAKSESPNRVLVSRFVGCGGADSSEDIFDFVYGMCYQLKRALGEKVEACPKVVVWLYVSFPSSVRRCYL